MHRTQEELKIFLDKKAEYYNAPSFVENDPIYIPHRFSLKQDIEIMGFFSAILAWGLRKTIIGKCLELSERFEHSPYQFIVNHTDADLGRLVGFKHRTFNDTDLLYVVDFLSRHYRDFDSLEDAFIPATGFVDIETSLIFFEEYFFNHPDAPKRTRKHIPTPARKSACKRINMFLRWMVRHDDRGVDFGIWKKIPQQALICPLDLHVERAARHLGLLTRKQIDWLAAIELTDNLRLLAPQDPVKYDFALFGLSHENQLHKSDKE